MENSCKSMSLFNSQNCFQPPKISPSKSSPPPSPRHGGVFSIPSPKHLQEPPKSPLPFKSSPTSSKKEDSFSFLSPQMGNGLPTSGSTPGGASSFSFYTNFLNRTANIKPPDASPNPLPTSPNPLPTSPKLQQLLSCQSPAGKDSPNLSTGSLKFSQASQRQMLASVGSSSDDSLEAAAAKGCPSEGSPFLGHLSFSLKIRNDSNNNSDARRGEQGGVRPPVAVANVSPYKYQLRVYLYPRHITVEHVVYSHK